ncbi:MerR family DNA-binding protein [Sphingopyxis sp.]|uniref:MerR family DNA-binding protein n=1 Tax=Sphingopyxis sp. TaxID=1908224 RepID=UPI003D0EC8C9
MSFILIAQQMGLRLEEIAAELVRLPAGRTPNGADWTRISTALRRSAPKPLRQRFALPPPHGGATGGI